MKHSDKTTPPVDLGPPVIAWSHAVSEIPERGLDSKWVASPADCEAVRAALDLLDCKRIETTYRIKSTGAGNYRVSGKISADVVQACVVTTDPVPQRITAPFEALFQPPDASVGEEDTDENPLEAVTTEQLENGTIPMGRLIYEEIASQIDPYPRVAGETLDWQDPDDAGSGSTSPFAKLAQLKDKSAPEK